MTIYNFELSNVPFANTAVASEIAPFPDYNRGLGIAFSQTDGKPEMKGLNSLFKIITTSVIYLKQRGISEWDSTLEYVAGKSFVVDGDKLYQAKTTNTNKQPSLSQNDWVLRASISDIKVSTNGNLKRTENQDGTITLEVPTASTEQRGAVRQATNTEVANKSNVNAYVIPKNILDMFETGERYIVLPNGMIFQWGVLPVNDNATYTVNLEKQYKDINFMCFANLQDLIYGSSNVFTVASKPLTRSSIQLKTEFSRAYGVNANWFTIGY